MIIKICKIHGELTAAQAWFIKKQNTYRCRQCRRDYKRSQRFKINDIDFKKLLKKQNNVCAICKKPESHQRIGALKPRQLCVDHCQKTGIIRGLLCSQCNLGLGKFSDSIESLISAAEYLKSFT